MEGVEEMANQRFMRDWVPPCYGYSCFGIVQEGNHLLLHHKRKVSQEGKRKLVSEYSGIIIPGGYLEEDTSVVSAELMRECGFTNALLSLCPLSLKDRVGVDWFDYLLMVIELESPTSYLLDRLKKREGNAIGPFRQRLVNHLSSMNITLADLMQWFGSIRILTVNGIQVVTPMTEAQKVKASELGMTHMEVLRSGK